MKRKNPDGCLLFWVFSSPHWPHQTWMLHTLLKTISSNLSHGFTAAQTSNHLYEVSGQKYKKIIYCEAQPSGLCLKKFSYFLSWKGNPRKSLFSLSLSPHLHPTPCPTSLTSFLEKTSKGWGGTQRKGKKLTVGVRPSLRRPFASCHPQPSPFLTPAPTPSLTTFFHFLPSLPATACHVGEIFDILHLEWLSWAKIKSKPKKVGTKGTNIA